MPARRRTESRTKDGATSCAARVDRNRSHLIHLETHPVVDLIVGKCYVILEGVVPGHAI
jgi:hypothetical protein